MTRCPSEAKVGEAYSTHDPRLAPHLETCAHCAGVVAEIETLRSLGRELPAGECSPAEREELRTSLLALASHEPRPPAPRARRGRAHVRVGAGVVIALACAASALVWSRTSRSSDAPPVVAAAPAIISPAIAPPAVVHGPDVPSAPPVNDSHVRGALHATAATRYARPGEQPHDVDRLTHARHPIEVTTHAPGERFSVHAGDAEFEEQGTSFVVEAKDDRLVRVSVSRGRVEVRREHEAPAVLMANDVWERSAPTSAPARTTAARPSRAITAVAVKVPESGPPSLTTPGGESPASSPGSATSEAAFDRGWELFRNQEFAAAAEAFTGALDPARSPVAEDASFWRSVALTRAGRHAEARAAWSEFLAGFPRSSRRGEGEVALGWLALDAGRLDEATRRVSDAAQDPGARLAEAARARLEATAQSRTSPLYNSSTAPAVPPAGAPN